MSEKVSIKSETNKKINETVFKAKKGSFDALKEAAAFAADKKLTNDARR